MKDASGKWVGWGLGDVDPKVTAIQKFLASHFKSYAGNLVATGTYDQATADAVSEMQRRYGLPVTGIFDYASQVKSHFITPAPAAPHALFFSVEGHMSDMWHGPVADTGTILEQEGRVRHQPIGYQNGSIPFDNASGTNELARLVGATTLDSGVPFPKGTPWILAGFSQGGIVITEFYLNHLLPGCDLDWRLPDLRGVLAYGNPCRTTGSVAPWSRAQAGPAANAGIDPLVRFGLPGYPARPDNWMDVYRKGDIFADNEPNTGAVAVKSPGLALPTIAGVDLSWLTGVAGSVGSAGRRGRHQVVHLPSGRPRGHLLQPLLHRHRHREHLHRAV